MTRKAVAHFKRTGLILPGHQGEIASYLSEHAGAISGDP